MILEAKFNEVNSELRAEFGTVSVVGGGGAEDDIGEAWTDGYYEGYFVGYEKGDMDGYEAGKASVNVADVLKYAKSADSLFSGATFPDGYELTIDISSIAENISNMFRKSMGMKRLTLIVQPEVLPNKVYNAGYFFYGTSGIKPTVEEIVLPDGIKFSDFGRFTGYCESLTTIAGSIDLSECTVTQYCFMNCYALREVRFVPETIKISIDFGHCAKLSVGENPDTSSIQSIVDGLATVTTSQTITLHATVGSKLTDAQKKTARDKNWTIVY